MCGAVPCAGQGCGGGGMAAAVLRGTTRRWRPAQRGAGRSAWQVAAVLGPDTAGVPVHPHTHIPPARTMHALADVLVDRFMDVPALQLLRLDLVPVCGAVRVSKRACCAARGSRAPPTHSPPPRRRAPPPAFRRPGSKGLRACRHPHALFLTPSHTRPSSTVQERFIHNGRRCARAMPASRCRS